MDFIDDDEVWYKIKDLDGFINSTRLIVFNNFGKNESETTGKYFLHFPQKNKKN